MKLAKIAPLLLAPLLLAAAAPGPSAVDRAAWSVDYARIKAGMARPYANLDWVRDHRWLDLAALDRRTRARDDPARWARQLGAALARGEGR